MENKIKAEIQTIFEKIKIETPRISVLDKVILLEIEQRNSVVSAALDLNAPILSLFKELLEQLLLFDPEEWRVLLYEEGVEVEIEELEKDYRYYQKIAKVLQKELGLTWSEEEEAWHEEKES